MNRSNHDKITRDIVKLNDNTAYKIFMQNEDPYRVQLVKRDTDDQQNCHLEVAGHNTGISDVTSLNSNKRLSHKLFRQALWEQALFPQIWRNGLLSLIPSPGIWPTYHLLE